jgi:hypothetical protein
MKDSAAWCRTRLLLAMTYRVRQLSRRNRVGHAVVQRAVTSSAKTTVLDNFPGVVFVAAWCRRRFLLCRGFDSRQSGCPAVAQW